MNPIHMLADAPQAEAPGHGQGSTSPPASAHTSTPVQTPALGPIHAFASPVSPPAPSPAPTTTATATAAAAAAAAAAVAATATATVTATTPASTSTSASAPAPAPAAAPPQLPPLTGPGSVFHDTALRPAVSPSPAHHGYHPVSPPIRKDTGSSVSTQATTATMASNETSNTSYSADTSPNLHQSIFSVKDGPDVSNSRRTSRRRTGPLSQLSRERAALIRKLGACPDCRRRRVACHATHHNLTWDEIYNKFHRSHSPSIQGIAPSVASARPLSPAPAMSGAHSVLAHDPQEMDIDPATPPHPQTGRLPLSEARMRTPLPSGPRLEKSMSLPGIETLKNDIQANATQIVASCTRGRYSAVHALLLFWQDDEDAPIISNAARDLADVMDKQYHYTFQIQPIPSSDAFKSSSRWLSRQVTDFAEDRDQRDVLKIIYYAGRTHLDDNRDMVLASSRDQTRACTIRWSSIHQIFEEACADTLIIMDAPYYPSPKMARQRGVLELIAASVSEKHFDAIDRCAFTRALTEQLRTRAARQKPLSAAELHSTLLSTYSRMVQDPNPEQGTVTSFPAPFHTMTSANANLPSVLLSPVLQDSPRRNSFFFESHPQIHLSITLNDDNADVESWNTWLRLMPEGIKDVKVDGPFRLTSR